MIELKCSSVLLRFVASANRDYPKVSHEPLPKKHELPIR